MEGRREFEDRLAGALEQARREGGFVAVIVGELLGLLRINTRFGYEAGAAALIEAGTRLETAVHGYADFVAKIGDAEFAVLLNRVTDRSDADRVRDRISAAFVEPLAIEGARIRTAMAMGVNVGPGRRQSDADMLWRASEGSTHARTALLQRMLSDVRGAATNLDEVAQVFADQGVEQFGLDACMFEIGERTWHAPATLPDRPPVASLPLRAEGRRFGTFRWWATRANGEEADDEDITAAQVLLDHVAVALDRAVAIDETEVRARTDSLTGLLNREGLARELPAVDVPYAVAVLDLDHFKAVNDAHGHDVGDEVLANLASLLSRGRTDDLVARWGGEEIVLVMPSTTVDGAAARMQRLLEEARMFLRVGDVGPITFSAGVTGSGPHEPFADAVRRADEAMYRAKRAGRARVEVG